MLSRLKTYCSFSNVTSAFGIAVTSAVAVAGTLKTMSYASYAAEACRSYTSFLAYPLSDITFAQHSISYPVTVTVPSMINGINLGRILGDNAYELVINATTPGATLADVSNFILGPSASQSLQQTLPQIPEVAATICSGIVTANGIALTLAAGGICLSLTAAYMMNNKLRRDMKKEAAKECHIEEGRLSARIEDASSNDSLVRYGRNK